MAYSFTTRDGQRVEVNVAAAFDRMAAAFLRDTGCSLHVRDGSRTREEQQREWDAYVARGYSPPRVAAPGTSNHEIDGPNGPRSLDLYDSGDDPGVTRFGTARDAWMQNYAGNFGFENEGNNFGEPWHKTFRGDIGGSGGGGESFPANERYGADWVRSIQDKLNRLGYGPLDVDGLDGTATQNAVSRFQQSVGLTADGIAGPDTNAQLDSLLLGGKLVVDGQWGSGTTRALQKALGVNVDGDIGPATISALQRKLGVSVDGQMGPATISGLQRLLKVTADGQLGPDTVRALQTYLNNGGTFDGAVTPPDPGKIVVDGDWGPATTSALQKVLGVTVDGQIGPNTIKALQIKLGVTADGEIGPATASALQKLLKVTVDGEIGPDTVKALQTYLNNGGNFSENPNPNPDPGGDYSKNNPAGRNVADIQRIVGATPNGIWDATTDAKIKAWQAKNGLEADGIWGGTSDGWAFPPAGSTQGMDYSFARPKPSDIYAAGFRHVGRYLWKPKYDDGRTNKGLSKDELDALTKAGLKVWLIYEEDGHELTGGYDAGVRVAKAAEEFRKALGLGELPIYFNVDYDAPAADLVNILKALDGIASVIGLNRTGLYAGYGPIKAAFDAKKITWGFQTYAWSGGKWDSRAQLQQWSNGQWGDSVDFTRAMVAEYGQNPVKATPDPDPKPDPEPEIWTIKLSKEDATVAGKALDQTILLLQELRKLLP